MPFGDPFGGVMFTVIPIIVTLGFVFVFGFFIVNAIRGVGKWKYNNAQPVLTVFAKIVSKRSDISRHMHDGAGDMHHHHSHTYTRYYATFEVESGDRMEFNLEDVEYGLLAEGDKGKLTFQGTRYLGFKREINL